MKKSTRITVNVREDEYTELVSLAEEHDVSLSRITRQAISEFLNRYGKGESQLPLNFSASESKSNG